MQKMSFHPLILPAVGALSGGTLGYLTGRHSISKEKYDKLKNILHGSLLGATTGAGADLLYRGSSGLLDDIDNLSGMYHSASKTAASKTQALKHTEAQRFKDLCPRIC